ncbi:MAG: isopeptide-forming domain-containing fimbrial protein [bacterium]
MQPVLSEKDSTGTSADNGVSGVEITTDGITSCTFHNTVTILGCTDLEALNPDEFANEDDGSCEYPEGADIAVAKTVNDATVDVGQTVTYTVTATNHGPEAAADVVLSDVLPAGLTFVSDDSEGAYVGGVWTVGALAIDGSATLTIVATVNSGTEGSTITNTASVTSVGGEEDPSDPNDGNDSASATVTVSTPGNPEQPTDVCPNINGNQSTVPSGYHQDGEDCVKDSSGSSSHHSGGSHHGSSSTPPAGEVLGAQDVCNFSIDTYMRKAYPKNNPEQVKVLQSAILNGLMNSGLVVDGVYGPKTEAAVKAFQLQYRADILDPWHITNPTGIFYKTTLAKAKNLICPAAITPIPADLINWSQNPEVAH